ncbi:N-acetylmuramic acid 6-phosphate etherase [[Mycoplasma] testudinis]|uniref:N-acetylmuramic acid 6-phosphate etherase n=1 Tax=[Mycoplasma] testudinis TaxID=33924 RepID=UPI0012EB5B08|nr:N-acetylmuramic acid 6-phosphate etherase [[Mycoplasma] testudinis]
MQNKILKNLTTEQENKNSLNIDKANSLEIVEIINNEDAKIAKAIKSQSKQIAKAIDIIVQTIQNKGRLVYIGSGTSGRLGVLDASEMLPTFHVGSETVLGIIAGGQKALTTPVEAAEDDADQSIKDLQEINFSKKDILVGISASGRTPYVVSALKYAKSLGAKTVSLSTSFHAEISQLVDFPIEPVTGPEVVAGSTRMKSGTCQKMVLNMLSTGTMIRLGKVYHNLMIDVMATNEKLIERSHQIVSRITKAPDNVVDLALKKSHNNVKQSCVMILKNVNLSKAKELLKNANDILANVIN